jgi:hypothetical protein
MYLLSHPKERERKEKERERERQGERCREYVNRKYSLLYEKFHNYQLLENKQMLNYIL